MWLIWREQNTRTFEDIERFVDLLKSLLVETLFEWSRIWDFTQCIFSFLISYNLLIPKKKRNVDGFTEDFESLHIV